MATTTALYDPTPESECQDITYTVSTRPEEYLQPGLPAQVEHPVRPEKPTGWVYDRVDTEFKRHVSFRVIDIEVDLKIFHAWQNDPFVAKFWEMAESEEKLAEYLEALHSDPHILGLMGYLDHEPFGYLEAYWCAEDRLGAYYDCQPFDRGWHGLTGSRKHLGRTNTITWIKGLCHYLFLDEPRTQRLMGEPRADNALLLRYANHVPYRKMCEFDFPHKRSALMQLDRSTFFDKVLL